jgi:hypothetical protein
LRWIPAGVIGDVTLFELTEVVRLLQREPYVLIHARARTARGPRFQRASDDPLSVPGDDIALASRITTGSNAGSIP